MTSQSRAGVPIQGGPSEPGRTYRSTAGLPIHSGLIDPAWAYRSTVGNVPHSRHTSPPPAHIPTPNAPKQPPPPKPTSRPRADLPIHSGPTEPERGTFPTLDTHPRRRRTFPVGPSFGGLDCRLRCDVLPTRDRDCSTAGRCYPQAERFSTYPGVDQTDAVMSAMLRACNCHTNYAACWMPNATTSREVSSTTVE